MTRQDYLKYFNDVIKDNGTFVITNWVNTDGYPCLYEQGRIHNKVPVPEGALKQSLYMAQGKTLYMGIMDYNRSTGDKDVDLNYDFESEVLQLSFNDISNSFEEFYDGENDYSILEYEFKLYGDSGEYFQATTVQDLPFSYEDQKEMKDFFDAIRSRFYETKVNIR
jgi:hypothetical protein